MSSGLSAFHVVDVLKNVKHLLALVISVFWMTQGQAQTGQATVPKGFKLVEPWELVQSEHRLRVRRIQQIARSNGDVTPRLFAYNLTPEEHGLDDYPVDIPVLRVVYQGEVFFKTDKYELNEDALEIIDRVADALRQEASDTTVFIAGHTDDVGSSVYNKGLGQRRAHSVARELATFDVKQTRVFQVSFGEHMPLASNATSAGRAFNRRVEFLFAAHQDALLSWLKKQPVKTCEAAAIADKDACRRELVFTIESVELMFESPAIQDGDTPQLAAVDLDHQGEKKSIVIGQEKIILDFNLSKTSIDIR